MHLTPGERVLAGELASAIERVYAMLPMPLHLQEALAVFAEYASNPDAGPKALEVVGFLLEMLHHELKYIQDEAPTICPSLVTLLCKTLAAAFAPPQLACPACATIGDLATFEWVKTELLDHDTRARVTWRCSHCKAVFAKTGVRVPEEPAAGPHAQPGGTPG
jgi:hypothetical protein